MSLAYEKEKKHKLASWQKEIHQKKQAYTLKHHFEGTARYAKAGHTASVPDVYGQCRFSMDFSCQIRYSRFSGACFSYLSAPDAVGLVFLAFGCTLVYRGSFGACSGTELGFHKELYAIHRATSQDKLPSGVIKVLSYNVMSFGFLEHTPQSPNPILQFIKSSGADIVCLQEAMLSSKSSQFVSLEDVKAYLPQYAIATTELCRTMPEEVCFCFPNSPYFPLDACP